MRDAIGFACHSVNLIKLIGKMFCAKYTLDCIVEFSQWKCNSVFLLTF